MGNTNSIVLAAEEGDLPRVEYLLSKGIDIDTKDKDGCTALIRAASIGSFTICKLLIQNGADINIKDKYGKTAYDSAKKRGRRDILKLIDDEREKILHKGQLQKPMELVQSAFREEVKSKIKQSNLQNDPSFDRISEDLSTQK